MDMERWKSSLKAFVQRVHIDIFKSVSKIFPQQQKFLLIFDQCSLNRGEISSNLGFFSLTFKFMCFNLILMKINDEFFTNIFLIKKFPELSNIFSYYLNFIFFMRRSFFIFSFSVWMNLCFPATISDSRFVHIAGLSDQLSHRFTMDCKNADEILAFRNYSSNNSLSQTIFLFSCNNETIIINVAKILLKTMKQCLFKGFCVLA